MWISVFASVAGILCTGCEPKARLTVRTVDDEGEPVVGAKVEIVFEHGNNPDKFTVKAGSTDQYGSFTAEHRTSGFVRLGSERDGYYRSSGKWVPVSDRQSGRWSPWDHTIEIVMRPLLKPTPLLVRQVEFTSTNQVGSCSYDLLKGDWLPPFGEGGAADLVFSWSGRYDAPTDDKGEVVVSLIESESAVKLSFSNADDGLIRITNSMSLVSDLELPNLAPRDGYATSADWQYRRTSTLRTPDTNPEVRVSSFLRVRTKTNELGKVEQAYYGKTEGDFDVFAGSKSGAWIAFKYYLNPTPNDRNLEYDETNNLFEARQPAGR